MKKKIKILLIILMSFVLFKTTYAVEDNAVKSTRTTTANETITEDYNRQEKMILEITGVEAGKKCENKEVSVDINVKNANYITAGTIQIKYDSRLQYINTENENSEYTIQSVNNKNESVIVIAFTSNEGKSGDFKICSLKFKLPEKIEEETYYNVSFGDETKIITSNNLGNNYKLTPAVIHCEKQSSTAYFKYILIILGIIVVLVLLIRVMNKLKNKKHKNKGEKNKK
ncbi:MAG: hypothetical protein J6K42_04140 [Clostridia bacterium]|nr:hypothetical protein [Clostridia bacterium]